MDTLCRGGVTPLPFRPPPPGHPCGTLELWGAGLETPGLVSAVGREQENVEPEVAPWGAPWGAPSPSEDSDGTWRLWCAP